MLLQLQEQLAELEHERDLLKESNAKLLNRWSGWDSSESDAFKRLRSPRSFVKDGPRVSLSTTFCVLVPSTCLGSKSGRYRSSS